MKTSKAYLIKQTNNKDFYIFINVNMELNINKYNIFVT